MKNKLCEKCSEKCKQESHVFIMRCPYFKRSGVVKEVKTICKESIDFTKRRKRTEPVLPQNQKNSENDS